MHRFAWLALAGVLLGCADSTPTVAPPLADRSSNGSAAHLFEPAAHAERIPAAPEATGAQAKAANLLVGTVVSIADGDTLTVLDETNTQHKVRLQGIDTPESGQPFGTRAREALAEKVFQQRVDVSWSERDRYQRILGDVHAGGRWINRELVAEGWAWHYRQYSADPVLAEAEGTARAAGRGLWSDPHPIPPWDWRRGVREPVTDERAEAEDSSPAPSRNGRPTAGSTAEALAFARDQERYPDLQPRTPSVTVYVTRTGSKYHAAGCRYLRSSSMPISLEAARARYSACSVCGGGGRAAVAERMAWSTPRFDHESQEWTVPGRVNNQQVAAVVFLDRSGSWRLRRLQIGGRLAYRDDETPSRSKAWDEKLRLAEERKQAEAEQATEREQQDFEERAAKHLISAKMLLKRNKPAARKWLQETIDDYPGTKAAAEATQLLMAL